MSELPSVDRTRLAPARYLEALDREVAALVAAARDLDAAVPGCPGWSVRDLLAHVVGVYRHKVAAIDADAEPSEPRGGWGSVVADEDVREVLRRTYDDLRARLFARDAGSPAWTWWPPEQTLGFWQRRMAQETAVHRWDAESAALGVAGAAPVDDDLAADGIDELLGWLTWEWGDDDAQPEADGQTVLVSTADHSWRVTLRPTRVEVAPGDGDGDAFLAGGPSGLLLYLWGRPGEHGVATMGDAVALRLLRARLLEAAN